MTAIREPQVSLNIIPAAQSAQLTDQKVLFIGQMTSGTATAGNLVQNIGVSGEENALFGAASHLAGMIRAARKLNQITQFDAIPLADNGSGVAATGTIVFTGPATASGTLVVNIGSSVNHSYTLNINNADTATTTASNLAALINADTYAPVTASPSTGTVTLTAVNKGTTGNGIGIGIVGTVSGIGFTITGMASGATDPSLTTVFTPVNDLRYQTIVWPNKYSKSTVTTFLDGRFNVNNNVLDGVAITSNTDTYSNIITAVTALNSKSLVYLANQKISTSNYVGSAIFELDDEIAAQFAAIRALRFTDGANISQYVISSGGALDSFGGIALASLPYPNTPLPNLPIIAPANTFTALEMATLATDGAAVLGNNISNTSIICGRIVTTYKTDSASNPDPSFGFLEYVDTMSAIREYFYVNLKAQYAQSRLTSGDLIQNRIMANAQTISAFCVSLYSNLANEALVQAGEPALQFYKENLTVTLDLSSGSATLIMKTPIVVQLRTIIGTLQLSFTNFS